MPGQNDTAAAECYSTVLYPRRRLRNSIARLQDMRRPIHRGPSPLQRLRGCDRLPTPKLLYSSPLCTYSRCCTALHLATPEADRAATRPQAISCDRAVPYCMIPLASSGLVAAACISAGTMQSVHSSVARIGVKAQQYSTAVRYSRSSSARPGRDFWPPDSPRGRPSGPAYSVQRIRRQKTPEASALARCVPAAPSKAEKPESGRVSGCQLASALL